MRSRSIFISLIMIAPLVCSGCKSDAEKAAEVIREQEKHIAETKAEADKQVQKAFDTAEEKVRDATEDAARARMELEKKIDKANNQVETAEIDAKSKIDAAVAKITPTP